MMNPTNNTDYYGTPYPFGVDPVRIYLIIVQYAKKIYF